MNESVKEYFDNLAGRWDSFGSPNRDFIEKIIAYAQIDSSSEVLDLGCGTGVLTPYLLQTNASLIKGMDISKKMIEEAKRKWDDPRVTFMSKDYLSSSGKYSHIICFNAFPHFLDKNKFVEKTKESLQIGGILIIAHDNGRIALDAHHDAHAKGVSRHLLPVEEEVACFKDGFEVLRAYDEDDAYFFILKRM